MDRCRAAAKDHARSQRKGQHRVRDEDNEQEVPGQLHATLIVLESDPLPGDACGSHRKHTGCIYMVQELTGKHTTRYEKMIISYGCIGLGALTYASVVVTIFPA